MWDVPEVLGPCCLSVRSGTAPALCWQLASAGVLCCLWLLVSERSLFSPWASGWEPRGLGWTGGLCCGTLPHPYPPSIPPIHTPPSLSLHLPSAGVQYPGGYCSTPIEPQTQGTPGQKLSTPRQGSGHKNKSKVLYDRVSCPSVTARGGIFETVSLDIPGMWLCFGLVGRYTAGSLVVRQGGGLPHPADKGEPSFQCLLGFGLFDLGIMAAPEAREEELPRKRILPGDIFLGHKSSTEPCCPGQLPAVVGPSLSCCAVSLVASVNTGHKPQPVGSRRFSFGCVTKGVT